jgi:hypothetical protein
MSATKAPTLLDDTASGVKEVRLEPVRPETALAPVEPAGLDLNQLAANPAVDVAKLERLIAMQERVLAREAEAAFNAAFAGMQGDIPTIIERASTDKTTYAPLEDIIEVVRPILKTHGFSLSFETQWPEANKVRVIGLLTHTQGHCRRSEFFAGADTSGSKNAIQSLGSSIQYGRRYVTKDLLCIVTRGEDDDAESSEKHKQPDGPPGYDVFRADLTTLAQKGTDALFKHWNKADAKLRQHVTRHDKEWWAKLREQAAKVGQ